MSSERWVWVDDDGKIFIHEENDGAAYLRHGPQASETEITLEDIKYNKELYSEALRKLEAHAAKKGQA